MKTLPRFSIVLFLCAAACAPARHVEISTVMNAPVRITVYSRSVPPWEEIFRRTQEAADVFDHRKAESPLARLNRTGREQVPAPLFSLLEKALRIAEQSRGAFDPTVLPLMRLWAFESGGRLPDSREIRSALKTTGFRLIRLEAPDTVRLEGGVSLDLGAIAEGAVADTVAAHLDRLGFESYLVDAAGEIVVRGAKPDGRPWSIAIRSPRREGMPRTSPDYSTDELGYLGRIELTGGRIAISTSGDYEKFFVRDNVAYHHILDPRSGRPARGAAAVTVVATTCAEADALATAAFVLGFEEGLAFLEEWPGAEGLVIREIKDGKLEMKTTGGFPKILPLEPPR